MKTDAPSGGGFGSGGRRRSLLLFALLLVVAQVLLFAFLRTRKRDGASVASAPPAAAPAGVGRSAARPDPSGGSPPQGSTPVVTSSKQPDPSVSFAEPEIQPLDQPENRLAAGRDRRAEREKAEREKAERARRERLLAERERERERARLEAERDRARLEAEKERARGEAERAEQARLEAERERAELEAERERLLAERSRAGAGDTGGAAASPARPAGSPDVLVVVVSSRAGAGSLGRDAIRNIYFGKTAFWPNNTPVRAYNRPAGSAAARKFYRSILGTSAGAFREHWNELQLSGGGIAPATVTSAESLVARVAGASGAIGYVLESELPPDLSGVRLIRFP
jgi:hypothetical protein